MVWSTLPERATDFWCVDDCAGNSILGLHMKPKSPVTMLQTKVVKESSFSFYPFFLIGDASKRAMISQMTVHFNNL
jgi:hypothetical protein